MFTISHVEKSGHGSLETAEHVAYIPSGTDQHEGRATVRAFGGSCIVSGVGHADYCDGTVYVMNEAGRTVARYDLAET